MGKLVVDGATIRSFLLIVASALVVAAFIILIPDSFGLEFQAKASLGLLFAMLILVVSNALPLIVTGITLMLCMYFFNILPYDDIWANFGNYIIFFVVAMFGLYAAILKTEIPKRIAGLVLIWAKTNSNKVVFGFVFATTLVSMVMSNIPTCMIFCGVAIGLLKDHENMGIGTRLGKALFLGIPAGSVMGGTAMLSGNAMNVLGVSLVQQFTGVEITFLEWMCVGVPTALVMAFAIAGSLCLIFKPEPLTEEALERTILEVKALGGLTPMEKKVITLLAVMIVFWIASGWITWLNTNVVALLGLIVMHLPGVKILEGDDLWKNTNWDIVVFIGCIISFMAGFQASGAAEVLVSMVLGNADGWSRMAILVGISVIPCIAHICIPSGPPVMLLTMVPLLTAGSMLGIDPFVVAFIVATWTGVQFMLPVEGLWMLSYGFHYFKPVDMLKWGWIPTLVLICVTVTLVPFTVGLVGFGA